MRAQRPVRFTILILCLAALLHSSSLLWAQLPVTGLPEFGSFAGGSLDTVNLANLNTHFEIPIFAKGGAGLSFHYTLSYDSLVWAPITSGSTVTWTPMANWGWRAQTEIATGYVTYDSYTHTGGSDCDDPPYYARVTYYYNLVYHDESGVEHPFTNYAYNTCDGDTGSGLASDGSGYWFSSFTVVNGAKSGSLYSRSGVQITPPLVNTFQAGTGAGTLIDPNGNRITTDGTYFYDSSGAKILTVTGGAPNSLVFAYTAPSGAQASVTISCVLYVVQTNFQIPGITEYGAQPQYLVDKVTFPDGSYYHFTYELTVGSGISGKTTGRIASVTLPTGGTISYSYAGSCQYNASNCMMADGSPSYLTRTLGGGTWTYSRALQPNQSNKQQTTTTVVDPASNETDLKFSGIYETERTVWSGAKSTVLDYLYTCYNANYVDSTCPTAVVSAPISSWGRNDHFNSITFSPPNSSRWSYYDAYGNLKETDDLDYASPPLPIRIAKNTYNACNSQNVCNEIATSIVYDGGSHKVAETDYGYDGNGNVTSVSRWISSTSSPLTQQYSYNANGTLATATDLNGTTTTYSYSGASCSNSFPTSVTVAGLTTRYTYNCTGGVVTSGQDPNLATTSTTYADPYFWRPASTTDALSNTTYYNYYGVNNSGSSVVTAVGQTESVMNFNSGYSTTDILATPDNYGRPWLQQRRQGVGSANFDTTQLWYDISGRLQYVLMPFVATAGGYSSGGPATGYTYDALGRTIDVADWTGVHTDYVYNLNDVKVTVSPAPTGENTKARQLEYDALGRLKSVCEVTAGGGAVACPQNAAPIGLFHELRVRPDGKPHLGCTEHMADPVVYL